MNWVIAEAFACKFWSTSTRCCKDLVASTSVINEIRRHVHRHYYHFEATLYSRSCFLFTVMTYRGTCTRHRLNPIPIELYKRLYVVPPGKRNFRHVCRGEDLFQDKFPIAKSRRVSQKRTRKIVFVKLHIQYFHIYSHSCSCRQGIQFYTFTSYAARRASSYCTLFRVYPLRTSCYERIDSKKGRVAPYPMMGKC